MSYFGFGLNEGNLQRWILKLDDLVLTLVETGLWVYTGSKAEGEQKPPQNCSHQPTQKKKKTWSKDTLSISQNHKQAVINSCHCMNSFQ